MAFLLSLVEGNISEKDFEGMDPEAAYILALPESAFVSIRDG